jgi:hypothetical protein
MSDPAAIPPMDDVWSKLWHWDLNAGQRLRWYNLCLNPGVNHRTERSVDLKAGDNPWRRRYRFGGIGDKMSYDVNECIQCGNFYIFTEKEERLYLEKGFDMPLRCPDCRKKKNRTGNVGEWSRHRDKKRDYRMKYGT